jgi:Protein of unknwon function (DUF3310)
MNAPDMINHPPHYKGARWESIEIIEALGNQFRLGNALKYLSRSSRKNGMEDIKKARWYLERELAAGGPCSSDGFDRRFYDENRSEIPANFSVTESRLVLAMDFVVAACAAAHLGQEREWRANVDAAFQLLTAYITVPPGNGNRS